MSTRMAWSWDEIEFTPAHHTRSQDSLRYSEDQPRDDHGRFEGGGSSEGAAKVAAAAPVNNTNPALMMASVPILDRSPRPESMTAQADIKAWVAGRQAEDAAAIKTWEEKNAGAGAADYHSLMNAWSSENSGLISRLSMDPEAAAARVAANPHDSTAKEAVAMDRFLGQAPSIAEPLYRGTGGGDFGPLHTGQEINLAPSSFSRSDGVAVDHAILGERQPTVLEVDGHVKGLPVDGLSRYPSEQEVISAGKFSVQSVSQESKEIYGKTVDFQRVIVKQVL